VLISAKIYLLVDVQPSGPVVQTSNGCQSTKCSTKTKTKKCSHAQFTAANPLQRTHGRTRTNRLLMVRDKFAGSRLRPREPLVCTTFVVSNFLEAVQSSFFVITKVLMIEKFHALKLVALIPEVKVLATPSAFLSLHPAKRLRRLLHFTQSGFKIGFHQTFPTKWSTSAPPCRRGSWWGSCYGSRQ
jgi:hypothetical protein